MRFTYDGTRCDIEISGFNRPVVEVNTSNPMSKWIKSQTTRFSVCHPDDHVHPIVDMVADTYTEVSVELSEGDTILVLRGNMRATEDLDWGKEISFTWSQCHWIEGEDEVLDFSRSPLKVVYRGEQYK